MQLQTDSAEYDILVDAASRSAYVDGMSLEFGVREGGSSQLIMQQYQDRNKIHIAVDPYGALPYKISDSGTTASWAYDNQMRNRAISSLYNLSTEYGVNFMFMNMRDTDFYDYFMANEKGIPIFSDDGVKYLDKFSMIFFDAEHTYSAVKRQCEQWLPFVAKGGIVVFDDIKGYYDHDAIENEYLGGFEVIQKGIRKASYIVS